MDIVKKYNNTYHNTIKIIPVHVILNAYINSSKEINDKNPKLKIGYIARISNYKNICPKSYVSNWCEEIFVIKKVKSTCISDLNGEVVAGMIYEKELPKTNQKEFRVDKVM